MILKKCLAVFVFLFVSVGVMAQSSEAMKTMTELESFFTYEGNKSIYEQSHPLTLKALNNIVRGGKTRYFIASIVKPDKDSQTTYIAVLQAVSLPCKKGGIYPIGFIRVVLYDDNDENAGIKYSFGRFIFSDFTGFTKYINSKGESKDILLIESTNQPKQQPLKLSGGWNKYDEFIVKVMMTAEIKLNEYKYPVYPSFASVGDKSFYYYSLPIDGYNNSDKVISRLEKDLDKGIDGDSFYSVNSILARTCQNIEREEKYITNSDKLSQAEVYFQ